MSPYSVSIIRKKYPYLFNWKKGTTASSLFKWILTSITFIVQKSLTLIGRVSGYLMRYKRTCLGYPYINKTDLINSFTKGNFTKPRIYLRG